MERYPPYVRIIHKIYILYTLNRDNTVLPANFSHVDQIKRRGRMSYIMNCGICGCNISKQKISPLDRHELDQGLQYV